MLGMVFWITDQPTVDAQALRNFSLALDRIPFVRENIRYHTPSLRIEMLHRGHSLSHTYPLSLLSLLSPLSPFLPPSLPPSYPLSPFSLSPSLSFRCVKSTNWRCCIRDQGFISPRHENQVTAHTQIPPFHTPK